MTLYFILFLQLVTLLTGASILSPQKIAIKDFIIWLLIIWSAIYSGKKELILIVAPAIGSVLALLVASCYPDYRYIWMMFLLTPFFILCYTVCRSRIKTVTNVFIQEKNEI